MPNYEASGTEPLRSNPTTKHAGQDSTAGPAGEDVGGRDNPRADTKVKSAAQPSKAAGNQNDWPAGVQSFTDGRV